MKTIIIYYCINNSETVYVRTSSRQKNMTWQGLEKIAIRKLKQKLADEGYPYGALLYLSLEIIVYARKEKIALPNCITDRKFSFRIELIEN